VTDLAAARANAVRRLRRRGLTLEQAEDAVQHALLQFVQKKAYQDRGRLEAWLVRVALNHHFDEHRSAAAFKRRLARLYDPGRDDLEDVDYRLDADRLLEPLLPRQRALLRLVASGVRPVDLARAENLPEQTVKSRIHRARETIRRAA
jgi:RNA polymerase sigma factor (sigma-70 family)